MQLNKNNNISAALSRASLILLAAPIANNANAADINFSQNEYSASAMIYIEENRVRVNEDVIQIKNEISDDEFVTATLIYDVMSGPSPSGAPITPVVQTITTPSGNQKTISAGDEPTYGFLDSRVALLANWAKPLSNDLKITSNASFSSEYDYISSGGGVTFSKETNQKHTTLSSGLALTYDSIKSVGGTPEGLNSLDLKKQKSTEGKTAVDWLFGVTQVVNRHSLMQLNYTLGYSSGYQSDPYKIIAFLDAASKTPVAINPYYYEKRPDTRLSHVLYLKYIHDFSGDVFNAVYRFFKDDWGISSHTLDFRYTFLFKKQRKLQLHARYYNQQRANFYHYALYNSAGTGINNRDVIANSAVGNDSLSAELDFASADHRLGDLETYTIGVKFQTTLSYKETLLDVRFDHFRQQDKSKRFTELRGWIAQIAAKLPF